MCVCVLCLTVTISNSIFANTACFRIGAHFGGRDTVGMLMGAIQPVVGQEGCQREEGASYL